MSSGVLGASSLFGDIQFQSKRIRTKYAAAAIYPYWYMLIFLLIPNVFNWVVAAPGHFLLQSFGFENYGFNHAYEFLCFFSFLFLAIIFYLNIKLASYNTFLIVRNSILIIIAVKIYNLFGGLEVTINEFIEGLINIE